MDTPRISPSPPGRPFHRSPPCHPSTRTPFNFQLALSNRIPDVKLLPGGAYDASAYPPIFFHDCLILPGSLANVLTKPSSEDIVRRMTPAMLPGFFPLIHPQTQQPCLVPSTRPTDSVHGMVLFGQGKKARRLIREHYRSRARRIKVKVEIEVTVFCSSAHVARDGNQQRRLQRQTIDAYAWLWAKVGSPAVCFGKHVAPWTIDEYLAGAYKRDTGLYISIEEVNADDDERIATRSSLACPRACVE